MNNIKVIFAYQKYRWEIIYIKRFSKQQSLRKRINFYKKHPESYKLTSKISKKIDFKTEKLEFPIHIPLKFRYVYNPEKELQQRPQGINDILNFKLMTGNQILLYVEQYKNLRLTEQLSAINELKDRDENNIYDLKNHPWVRATINNLIKQLSHFNKAQISQFYLTLYRYGIEEKDTWELMERFIKQNIPYMKPSDFGMNYLISFRDDGWRTSDEFKKELSLLLPNHLKNLNPLVVAETFKLNEQFGLVTDYLFEDFYHHVVWKQPGGFIRTGAIGQMLEFFRKRNYDENEEFIWPELYKKFGELIGEVDREVIGTLIECLEAQLLHYKSHEKFNLSTMIRQLEDRRVWEESLGKKTESISLIQMVQNDLKFWREKQQLQLAKN